MKIYSVTFNEFTNYMKDTVSNRKQIGSNDDQYIGLGSQPLLVTEDQIEAIKQYGGGIETLKFVGNLWSPRVIPKGLEPLP